MGMGIRSGRPTVTTTLAVLGLGLTLGLGAGCGQGVTDAGGPAGSTDAGTVDPAPTDAPSTEPAPSAPEDTLTPTPDGPASSLPALPSDPAGAELVLVVGPEGAEQPPVVLACDFAAGTATGDHPQAEQACADLQAALQAGDPFAPVSPDAMCTQQYGGDAVVRVTGAVLAADGGPVDVDATFTLTDGCQIGRFEAMGAVLAPYRGSV